MKNRLADNIVGRVKESVLSINFELLIFEAYVCGYSSIENGNSAIGEIEELAEKASQLNERFPGSSVDLEKYFRGSMLIEHVISRDFEY